VLHCDVAEVVHLDDMAFLTTGEREDQPDDPPQTNGEQTDQEVQQVV